MKTAISMGALRYWYAQQVVDATPSNDETRARMVRALQSLKAAFGQSQDGKSEAADPVQYVQEQLRTLPEPAAAIPYLIELWTTPTFAPHDIKVPAEARLKAMEQLLDFLRLPVRATDREEYGQVAQKAYRIDAGKLRAVAQVAGVALATGTVLFAGAVAVMSGGLTLAPSAAIITSALAALGGGAVATGGFGMVGGVAVLIGSAAGGGLTLYAQQALQQLGVEGLRAELVN